MLFLRFSDGSRLAPSKNRQINVFRTDFLIFPYNLYSHDLVTAMQALTSTSRVFCMKIPCILYRSRKKSVEKTMFWRFSDGTLLAPSKNRQTNIFRTDFLKNHSYSILVKQIRRKNGVFTVFG